METVSLEITDIAFGGAGVARAGGKVYFVPFTAPGDRVEARVTRDKKKFAEARIVTITAPSPERIEPRCRYFQRCGGCAYQHLAYPAQLALKEKQVRETLHRVGRLETVPMQPIVPSPEPYAFRNRIRLHILDGEAGFFAHSSHRLVPVERCEIARPEINEQLATLRRRPLQDGDYTLTIGERGDFFEQTNDAVAALLLDAVEAATPAGRPLVIDTYCGAGFFARRLASRAQKVIGIEENEFAIAHARAHATPNEQYIAGDVAAHLGDLLQSHDRAGITLVLDPPATGLSARVLDLLAAYPPAEILYVSCNPATLARDLACLARVLTLVSITPFDMFPQTAEIEALAILRSAEKHI